MLFFRFQSKKDKMGNLRYNNIEENKNKLLENALMHDVNLTHFEIYSETLEDIFLKLVVQK